MGGTSIFLLYVGDCDVGGMNGFGRGNRSTRRKSAPTPLCPPQIRTCVFSHAYAWHLNRKQNDEHVTVKSGVQETGTRSVIGDICYKIPLNCDLNEIHRP
jgi:hypothetical protein